MRKPLVRLTLHTAFLRTEIPRREEEVFQILGISVLHPKLNETVLTYRV